MEWEVNRGVGRPLELKGLQAQYVYWLAGGLGGAVLLVIVLYIGGASGMGLVVLGGALGMGVVWGAYWANGRYGQFGLSKLRMRGRLPRSLAHRMGAREMLGAGGGAPGSTGFKSGRTHDDEHA